MYAIRSYYANEQRTLVEILATNIAELTSPFASHFSSKLNRLTPAA